ncbi:hypothetical protein [Faecalispora sporosphaeroides]|jgi:hypothetical protein|uniref:Uncharacterized protein n=1 Tax=Faecalispora sporosphaeroides TaxID=1549 RepID=A0A928KWC2_9FIRM|nr:hypothetical protein [Faecalispora sporosphaeroides]MBE6833230.1 hypothetical protein [Faecalispora sporosphaeroides]
MDDLSSKINELLSDPQAMQQLNSLAASLGLGNSTPNPPTSPGQNAPAGNNPLQGLDLSSLAGLLGNAGSAAPGGGNIPQSPGAAGGLDTAKLGSLLSSLGGAGGLNALSGLLGGGGGGGGLGALTGLLGGGVGGGLDSDTLQVVSKILPLLSTFRQEDNNTRLLHALRPLLGPERQKKVDEAIKMLSMLRLLPVLRGQGIL